MVPPHKILLSVTIFSSGQGNLKATSHHQYDQPQRVTPPQNENLVLTGQQIQFHTGVTLEKPANHTAQQPQTLTADQSAATQGHCCLKVHTETSCQVWHDNANVY